MGTIEIIRDEVIGPSGVRIARSPARTLLGAVELAPAQLNRKYAGALDLVLFQQSGLGFTDVPPGLRSRLLGARVATAGGGMVGTVERFEDPLQPVVYPLVVIAPDSWPPPPSVPLWQRVLPQASIQPGLAVILVLAGSELQGEITAAPRRLQYVTPDHSALAAQARFPTTILSTAHGAPVVCRDDPQLLVGMLIGTQTAGGETLTNIFPLAAEQPQ